MSFRFYGLLLACVIINYQLSIINYSHAQFKDETETQAKGGATRGESLKLFWESGFEVTAAREAYKNVKVVVPVPMDWPEQKVKLIAQEASPNAKTSFKEQNNGIRYLEAHIPQLPAGEKAAVLLRYEVEAFSTVAPEETAGYKKPDVSKIPKEIKPYLQKSVKIESADKKIIALAKEIGKDAENAWSEVEAVYDWVRKEIEYVNGDEKGALAALKDKTGDCKELSALFIAICRAKGIPARMVRVPDHAYAEFYLVDADGTGHWFPCQTAGDRAFGEMPFQYVILQKGDNMQSVLSKEKVTFLKEQWAGASASPRDRDMKFTMKIVAE